MDPDEAVKNRYCPELLVVVVCVSLEASFFRVTVCVRNDCATRVSHYSGDVTGDGRLS